MSIREISVGVGLPYSIMSGDLSDTSYGSGRIGLLEFRRRVESLQFHSLVFQFCRRVWRRWVTLEALAGRIDPDAFAANPEAYLSCRWLTPKEAWLDPKADAIAEAQAIASGLLSRRAAVASRGLDIEELDREIAADRERERSLGLDFSPRSPAQGATA
jgi:lambda family phage portal protein